LIVEPEVTERVKPAVGVSDSGCHPVAIGENASAPRIQTSAKGNGASVVECGYPKEAELTAGVSDFGEGKSKSLPRGKQA
jgi:hypothetical protein